MPFVVLSLLVGFAWYWRGLKRRAAVISEKVRRQALDNALVWPELGQFGAEVVGESYYQAALTRIVGSADDAGVRQLEQAVLVPEDDNPHDSQAVGVYIQDFKVGHLSREGARTFRRRLAAKKAKGLPSKCGALVVGGHKLENGTRASYGVWLDIKSFD